MTLAEDRTEQYIRLHLSHFFRIDVLEILSHLPCLTAADQDKLRAYIERYGNRDSVWKLFDHLRKRTGWVTCLITALRECEHSELAEQIESVYTSNLNRFQNQPRGTAAPAPAGRAARNQPMSLNAPPRPPGVPASRSPSAEAASSLPDTAYNGYPEELESEKAGGGHTAPIQDTQPPESKAEVPGAALSPAHSGDTSRNPQSSSGRSSPFSAPAPTVTRKHRKVSGGSGDSPPGSASLPASRGPLSPSVSFVPHSTKKAGPASGPQLPPSPHEASSPTSSWGNENQLQAASPIQATELPEGTVPATRIPRPQKVPPLAPKFPSSPHPAQTPQMSPGPAASRQAPPPHVEEAEMSKPGVLQSCDDQPYSGGSERLLISTSSGSVGPLHIGSAPGNLPEENDYFSVTSVPSAGKLEASCPPQQLEGSKSPFQETLKLHVDERPSEGPLGSSPGSGQTPGTAAQPGEHPYGDNSWGVWVGSAVAVVLFSVAVAIFYKRIPK
ncbi:mitochondrial antiviral-signaling protein isoform X2 [Sminthopsis crassicaudata]|uniref:mitochondrial antiviral-signaling protein isoform X2 n=1 Tax=Sminthopsis crassicaudata TaxID=9301 RepID=UPI003D680855